MHHDHHVVVQHEPQQWPVVSDRCRQLIRQGALTILDPEASFVADLQAASLSGDNMRVIARDPVLAEGSRLTTTANVMHWATANVENPGERVRPLLGPAALASARDMVRRGLDKDALESYRKAQSLAWQLWLGLCFELTDDPVQLREVLEVTSVSISSFIDDTITAISARMDAERDDLTRGTHAERRAVLALLLEGAPIDPGRAQRQLSYRFAGDHTAIIVWGPPGTDAHTLEKVAESVMIATGAERRLTIVAGASALWLWVPRAVSGTSALRAVVDRHPVVRIALGRTASGLDGFRSTHLEAATTQRMLDALRTHRRVASFRDVQFVALLSHDTASADEFIADTLGALAEAESELRELVLTYIRDGCNTSSAASRLYIHRNTVVRRLAQAEALLPRPLNENLIQVAAALELLAWHGGSP
ncbi:transcriptional regulator [Mycolicibacterium phocaicum]|uniref:Transcriptional regulator n=2 Tax=Mycolicibacterium phocaicum TaxID=319706 RepID=A0AA94UG36_9MYCO|nr:transcriptional regulator [Mycolicibacterium phocaicum]